MEYTYTYRIYPNKEQEILINKTFGTSVNLIPFILLLLIVFWRAPIFSIENLLLNSQYSFQEITELISNKINSNASINKTKVLRKESDNNETNNY